MAQRLRKEAELNARNHGVAIAATSTNGKRSLSGAVAEYLEQIELSKKQTHAAYSTALDYFQESCAKPNLGDLEKKDLLKYAAFLRDESNEAKMHVERTLARKTMIEFAKNRPRCYAACGCAAKTLGNSAASSVTYRSPSPDLRSECTS